MILSLRSLFLISFIGIFICGCSSNSSQPTSPDNHESSSGPTLSDARAASSSGTTHYLLQYGYIFIDLDHPDGPQFEVIPVRQGEIHLNILKLLEIAPCDDCFIVVGFDFPEPGILNVDILIEHPMTGLEYSVFDVRCIMMFNGSHEFPTSGKTISDPALGDGILLDPDGYTALYNGSTLEAPTGDYQKYFQGELATWLIPDSDINGYKYFKSNDPSNYRNAFYAGSSDVQTFSLQLPPITWVIGYAVDASWEPPVSTPVDDPLTDFDLNANCTEPWKVVVTEQKIGPGLTVFGGQTKLLIDIYDWQGKSTHHAPIIECPEIFSGFLIGTWVSDGADYTRYEVSVSNDNKAPVGDYICLAGVIAIENNPVETPWLDLTAYQIFSLVVTSTAGELIWVKRAGSTEGDYGHGVTALSDDSTVVVGGFSNSCSFGQSEPNETVLNSMGSEDIFIARYNPDGSLVWVRGAGGSSYDRPLDVTALSDNSTVVTGFFYTSTIFGQGEPNETVLISNGASDIFIARYNPDGSLVWAKQASGETANSGMSVTVLSDDSPVVTGYFGTTAIFGLGETNETVLISAGDCDIFIARYNPDGSLVWAKQAGGILIDQGYGITALTNDSTVVTGSFEGSATFGKGESNETILNSAGDLDIFIVRYNPDGSLVWAKQAGGEDRDAGDSITTLADNSTVMVGYFSTTAIFGLGESNETILESAGNRDVFIARYNSDGILAWAKRAGGIVRDSAFGIVALSDNSTVVTGSENFIPLESGGVFISRYNSDGTLAWVKQVDSNLADVSHGIAVLSDDSTVATGLFTDTITFGQGESNETVLETNGFWDIFIARYAP